MQRPALPIAIFVRLLVDQSWCICGSSCPCVSFVPCRSGWFAIGTPPHHLSTTSVLCESCERTLRPALMRVESDHGEITCLPGYREHRFGCDADYPIWIPSKKHGRCTVSLHQEWKGWVIDANGHVVVQPKLTPYGNSGSEFHDGLLEAAGSNGKYVDRTGKLVIDTDLYRGWDFSEGLARRQRKG